jgi:hypothetical protein
MGMNMVLGNLQAGASIAGYCQPRASASQIPSS